MEEVLWWTAWLLDGKNAHRGKHRTEVTEATEGMEAAWKRFFGGQPGFWAGKRASAKASHRGHGGHRGGWRLHGEGSLVDNLAFGRENGHPGKHRTEVAEATEGD